MKTCKTCNKLKQPKDFYSTNKSVCKKCLKERTILWHKNNPKGLKRIQARTRAKPGYKEKQAKFYKQWYAKKKGRLCDCCGRKLRG